MDWKSAEAFEDEKGVPMPVRGGSSVFPLMAVKKNMLELAGCKMVLVTADAEGLEAGGIRFYGYELKFQVGIRSKKSA